MISSPLATHTPYTPEDVNVPLGTFIIASRMGAFVKQH